VLCAIRTSHHYSAPPTHTHGKKERQSHTYRLELDKLHTFGRNMQLKCKKGKWQSGHFVHFGFRLVSLRFVSTRSIEPAAAARKTKDQNRCSAKLKRKCQSRIRIRIRPSLCVCVRVSVQRLRLGQVCQSASACVCVPVCECASVRVDLALSLLDFCVLSTFPRPVVDAFADCCCGGFLGVFK